jgi:RHS repeat-associated protein
VGAANSQGKIEELRLLGKRSIPVAIEIQGTPYVPLHDHLGHCNTLLDMASNQVIETYDHTAFGLEQIFDGDGNAQEGSINPWRYASKRFDLESGFIYFGKRYYVPSLIRWLTPDPLGVVDGINLYPFLRNNPFRYIDPDGQFVVAIPFIMIAWGAVETAIATVTSAEVLVAVAAVATVYASQKAAQMVANSVDQNVYEEEKKEEKRRKEANFPGTPQQLAKDPKWMDVTHPEQRKAGHEEFQNLETGERIRFDKGKPDKSGHGEKDHYHRYNPNTTGDADKYLDADGNPVHKNDDLSHLYPPEGVIW